MKKSVQPRHALRHLRHHKKKSAESDKPRASEEERVCPGDKHDDESGHANENGCAEIDFPDDQTKEKREDQQRINETVKPAPTDLLVARKPPGEEEHRRDTTEL